MSNKKAGSGTLRATYIHSSCGGSATPGKQIGTVLATSEGTSAATGTWNYYFQDAIGSTRGLWDQDGDRIGKYEYSPFGGKYADHGEDITRKFTGHAWDSEARLYYTAYRYYSPDANRWITRDPLGMVDGPNVYAYVVGNPVSLVDPSGGSAWSSFLGWFGGTRGDGFDQFAEFMGRCVGGASAMLLLTLIPFLPFIHGTGFWGSAGIKFFMNGATTPGMVARSNLIWFETIIGSRAVGYGSLATMHSEIASIYGVGLAGGAYIVEILDLLDIPFNYYTDRAMGGSPEYSCKDVLMNLFGMTDKQAQQVLACNS